MRFTVMSFNVRGSFHDDSVNDWDQRRDLNVDTIRAYMPDIIGFQEAQSGNLAAYERTLTEYDVELGLISIRQSEKYHRVPIYWKRARFERLDAGGFYLSATPERWSSDWGSTLVRAATWVTLRAVESGAVFTLLNTHFPHEPENDTARSQSAGLMMRRLAEIAPTFPHVVLGDFNALPDSEAYQVFIESGYADTFDSAGSEEAGAGSTFHGFEGTSFSAGYRRNIRIDWILTKDAGRVPMARRCTIVRNAAPPLYPSDHYPLLVELDLA